MKALAILLIFGLLSIPFQAKAAISAVADGQRASHYQATAGYGFRSVDTQGTFLIWFYPTDDTARQVLFNAVGGGDWQISWRADLAGDNFEGFRALSPTYLSNSAAAANFAAYGLNKWLFMAFTFNTAGAAGDQKLYMGDLTRLAREPSSYVSQTAGSGSTIATGPTLFVGNSVATTREFHGRIAHFSVWNRALTQREIWQQQFRPHVTSGNVLFTHYGYANGLTTHTDWSGYRQNGTSTSIILAPHVPIGNNY